MGLNEIQIWQIQKGVYLKLYDGIAYTLREINRLPKPRHFLAC